MSLSRVFDRIAIALSAVCILHCLTVPVLIALLPIVSTSLGETSHFHDWMLLIVVPTSLIGFGIGLRWHDHYWIAITGAIGLAIVAAAALVAHDAWPFWQEVTLSVAGSAVLAFAHWRNFVQVSRPHSHESRHP